MEAGTFDCVVVKLRTEFYEMEGAWGYSEDTIWCNPAVGHVKSIMNYWMTFPFIPEEQNAYLIMELVSTNVSYRQDFDGDYDVDIKDLAMLLAGWSKSPGQAGWNADCDLNSDDIINEADMVEFLKYWHVGGIVSRD